MSKVFITMEDKRRLTKKLRDAIDESGNHRIAGVSHSLQGCRDKLKKCGTDPIAEVPDILMLSLACPGGNIADFCAEIRENYPGIKIVLLTDDAECTDSWHIIKEKKNANAYIRKDALPVEIKVALDAVMNGHEYLGGHIHDLEAPPEASPEWFMPLEKEILNLTDEACSDREAIERLFFIAGYINRCRVILIADLLKNDPPDLDDDTTEKYLKILIESLLVEGYSNWEIAGRLGMEDMGKVRIQRMRLIQKLGSHNSMLFAQRQGNELVRFTPDDIELMRLIIAGLTTEQIAAKLHRSPDAIHSRRQELISKSGAEKTIKLIIYAFRQGLIKIEDIDALLQNK